MGLYDALLGTGYDEGGNLVSDPAFAGNGSQTDPDEARRQSLLAMLTSPDPASTYPVPASGTPGQEKARTILAALADAANAYSGARGGRGGRAESVLSNLNAERERRQAIIAANETATAQAGSKARKAGATYELERLDRKEIARAAREERNADRTAAREDTQQFQKDAATNQRRFQREELATRLAVKDIGSLDDNQLASAIADRVLAKEAEDKANADMIRSEAAQRLALDKERVDLERQRTNVALGADKPDKVRERQLAGHRDEVLQRKRKDFLAGASRISGMAKDGSGFTVPAMKPKYDEHGKQVGMQPVLDPNGQPVNEAVLTTDDIRNEAMEMLKAELGEDADGIAEGMAYVNNLIAGLLAKYQKPVAMRPR